MKTNPKVSIIIPVYNGSKYLGEAIDSALAQTYTDREVIVVNDGSTDNGNTEQIALSYGTKIRYYTKPNGGVSSALNMGIREAMGEYISWLSHDDVYLPDKLEEQIRLVENLSKSVVLYSDYELINAASEHIAYVKIRGTENLLRYMFTSYPLNGCTMLIPKAHFATVGLFNEALRTTQDYDMWFRMLTTFDFIYMPKPYLKSRLHEGQGSGTIDAQKERSQLYTAALRQFTIEEIYGQSPGTNFAKYLNLSLGLKLLDVSEASLFARNLAIKQLSARTPVIIPEYLLYLIKWYGIGIMLEMKRTIKRFGPGKKFLRLIRRLLAI